MNKKLLSHLEKRLLEERARVMKELGIYEKSFAGTLQSSDGDLSSYSFHMADQGTDAMEREKEFLFPIMAYAAKFASCFYAPFRDAANSSTAIRRSPVLSDGSGEQAGSLAGD